MTKNHPAEKIHCLYRNGICEFAENRVQELKEKAAILPQDIHWHLIGPLQSNKVRQAVQVAKTIHSVDNEALAQRISRIAVEEKKNINIFIQVNITGEIQKSGVSTISLEKVLKSCSQLPNIKLSGLMTMGPLSATREDNIATFQTLKDLSIKYKAYFDSKTHFKYGYVC